MSKQSILRTLNDKEYCTPKVMHSRYRVSKLLNVLFTRAFFQHQSQSSKIISTAVDPGFCVSEILRKYPVGLKVVVWLAGRLLRRTGEQGARQLVWAALGPDGKDGPHVKHTMGGAYVSLAAVPEASDFAISKEGYETQEKIWNETISILSEVVPPVRAIMEEYFSK